MTLSQCEAKQTRSADTVHYMLRCFGLGDAMLFGHVNRSCCQRHHLIKDLTASRQFSFFFFSCSFLFSFFFSFFFVVVVGYSFKEDLLILYIILLRCFGLGDAMLFGHLNHSRCQRHHLIKDLTASRQFYFFFFLVLFFHSFYFFSLL